ncbi:MAG: STAS/SEC14 domain-containing protein [Desulfococcaceae bacterium]
MHADHIERMAVVGDRTWKNTWVALFGLFGGIDTRYFDNTEMKAAWEWVRE